MLHHVIHEPRYTFSKVDPLTTGQDKKARCRKRIAAFAALVVILISGAVAWQRHGASRIEQAASGAESALAELNARLATLSPRTDALMAELVARAANGGPGDTAESNSASRAKIAKSLGITAAELDTQLAAEISALRGVLGEIDSFGPSAIVKGEKLRAIKLATHRKLGDAERGAKRYENAITQYRAAGALVDKDANPKLWCDVHHDLLTVLWYHVRYHEALPIAREVVAIRERTLGVAHPDTLHSVQRLANLLYADGDLAAAGPLYRRALESLDRDLGPDHPDTLYTLGILAHLLRVEGDLAAAEPLYRRALESRRRTGGAKHSETYRAMFNLAALFKAEGKFADAIPLAQQAYEGRRAKFGDHSIFTREAKELVDELTKRLPSSAE